MSLVSINKNAHFVQEEQYEMEEEQMEIPGEVKNPFLDLSDNDEPDEFFAL